MSTLTTDDNLEACEQTAINDALVKSVESINKLLTTELEYLRARFGEFVRTSTSSRCDDYNTINALRAEIAALQVERDIGKIINRPIEQKLDAILACLSKPPATTVSTRSV